MMVILYVIIYGIMELLYPIFGKINNIKIQKEHKAIDQIEHWLCNKLTMRRRFQIRSIIMIQLLQINMIVLWQYY